MQLMRHRQSHAFSTTVPVELNIIDVKAQREYYHEYGARIPVLKRHDNQAELGWPFELAELNSFYHEPIIATQKRLLIVWRDPVRSGRFIGE